MFEFLERGACPEAVAIRRWMDAWFRKFPAEHREPLKRRLVLKAPGEFMSAYFELQVFAMLRRLDCDVVVHPCLPGTAASVDFGATMDRDEFYVEATVCGSGRGTLMSNANEEDAVGKIKDAFPQLHSDIRLSAKGELRRTLGTRRLVEPIRKLLDSHAPEEVTRTGPLWEPAETLVEEGGWVLRAELRPPRRRNGRGVIRGPVRSAEVHGAAPLAKALAKKAHDWRSRGLSEGTFLIAVNVCHGDVFLSDREEAIYRHTDSGWDLNAFSDVLSCVAGVIVFHKATIGREWGAPVQMYANPGRHVPECLGFLRQDRSLAGLIGME